MQMITVLGQGQLLLHKPVRYIQPFGHNSPVSECSNTISQTFLSKRWRCVWCRCKSRHLWQLV